MVAKGASWWVLAVVLVLALLVIPSSGWAHGRVHVGIGLGWWAPPWPPPPPLYYGPVIHIPVRVPPPPPPCYERWIPGRWERRVEEDEWGFGTVRWRWVPGHWERVCP